jgi:glycerol-3-phosphate acyltransferase PlsX
VRLGVDLMGSDSSPIHLWQGLVDSLHTLPSTTQLVALVTPQAAEQLAALCSTQPAIELAIAEETFDAAADPMSIIRTDTDSTLKRGILALEAREFDAFVTCANTTALVAASVHHLPLFEGIRRPALLAELPTPHGKVLLADVGASLAYTAPQLVQLAYLGAAYCRISMQCPLPRLALLNIGAEAAKGGATMRAAYQQLAADSAEQAPFSFIGNVEGRDLFHRQLDLIVCEGFAGNILLKTVEGVGMWFLEQLRSSINPQHQTSAPLWGDLQKQFDYLQYPGALLCGLDRLLVKCHGSATPATLARSILFAADLHSRDVVGALRAELTK